MAGRQSKHFMTIPTKQISMVKDLNLILQDFFSKYNSGFSMFSEN
jgi:hypothetical protein